MNNFLISSSHTFMYGKRNIRVLEGVVELRMGPLLAQGCKRNKLSLLVVDAFLESWATSKLQRC